MLPASLRDDFPILQQSVHGDRPLVFLDNAASTQRSRQVMDAVRRLEEHDYANVHRGIHTLSERSTDAYEAAREKVRAFINAESADEIVFTQGTTASINLVARSWGEANLKPGDEILLTLMEHHSNLVPWFQAAERTGAVVRQIPITDDGLLDLSGLDSLLTRRTKLVAVASVSNTLGTINPVAEIIRRAHAVGALVLVDAAQSVPHMATDVRALDVDFLAFSGHKMTGPSGIGVLYGKRSLLEAMPAFLGGGSMIDRVYADRFTPAPIPTRFEAGTPPISGAIGLGAAIDYLQAIGMDAIQQHEHRLVEHAWRRLGEVEGLTRLGPPPEQRAGLVGFTLDRPHAHDIAQLLDEQGVAVRAGHHCTQPLHDRLGISASTRASFYLYNTLEEVDVLVDALAAIRERFRPRGRKRAARVAEK
ncbi:putative cysteine desulfurase [Pirellulimonas nuda]|uniref:Cysteine desulfurase n=1 Tax=Pirellulimonas nuda TaxID=2528009 RepID=A0A518DJ02_9BACT|nr:cysteine desulfurase [Pirellulimonas nuda]QDU91412.1 putative cysteine desulfurase [Pirellulimonas nuda]